MAEYTIKGLRKLAKRWDEESYDPTSTHPIRDGDEVEGVYKFIDWLEEKDKEKHG